MGTGAERDAGTLKTVLHLHGTDLPDRSSFECPACPTRILSKKSSNNMPAFNFQSQLTRDRAAVWRHFQLRHKENSGLPTVTEEHLLALDAAFQDSWRSSPGIMGW